jgi:hypothetical protein
LSAVPSATPANVGWLEDCIQMSNAAQPAVQIRRLIGKAGLLTI